MRYHRALETVTEPVLSVAAMRAGEQALIKGGIDVHQLMQIAGRGAAQWVWRVAAGRRVTVLCGPGNNGGDGYVIAEALRERGLGVCVAAPMEPATEAARRARAAYKGDVAASAQGITGGVLVDCLFGSGLSGPLTENLAECLSQLAAAHSYLVAIDLPSGVQSDQGAILSPVPQYDLTIALGAWKHAHFLMPARKWMGALKLVDIGLDTSLYPGGRIARPALAAPAVDTHKYRRGLLGIVSGAMPGAAILSAQAAMRAGAGFVKLLSDGSHLDVGADQLVDGRDLAAALSDDRFDAVLAGPGLGLDERARIRLAAVMQRDLPAVLDADALTMLAPDMLAQRTAPMVATPHEGELARIEVNFAIDPQSNKVDRAVAAARATGAIIIAKGPDTVVASGDGRIGFADSAPSWLSTAGTGDVLAGIVASRLATGIDPFTAACEGVWLHAQAARLAGPAFTAGTLAQMVSGAYAACL